MSDESSAYDAAQTALTLQLAAELERYQGLSVAYLGLLVAHSDLVRARWRVDNGREGHVAEAAVRNRAASARLLARIRQALRTSR